MKCRTLLREVRFSFASKTPMESLNSRSQTAAVAGIPSSIPAT
jgi:hypothetical protein